MRREVVAKVVGISLALDPAVAGVHVDFETMSFRWGDLREVSPMPNKARHRTAFVLTQNAPP